jgi:ABC-type amino acid transport substrate-binding protein
VAAGSPRADGERGREAAQGPRVKPAATAQPTSPLSQDRCVRARSVPGTLEQGISKLQSGDLDLLLSVARTEQRAKVLAYHTEPVLHSWSEIYASGDAGIRKSTDLSFKRVVVPRGSIQVDLLSALKSDFHIVPTLVTTESFPESIAAVVEGRADAAITNPFNGSWLAAHDGLHDTAIAFAPMDIFFPGRPDWMRAFCAPPTCA